MKMTERNEYGRFTGMIGIDTPGAVYPLSVAEGIQDGDILEDCGCALIWHRCGFAVIEGEYGEKQLGDIYRLMTGRTSRRLVLFSRDTVIKEFFSEKTDIEIGTRLFFSFGNGNISHIGIPEGFETEEIGRGNIDRIAGSIIPSFSWDKDEFLAKGKGYCIRHGDEVVSWAFSAAVSTDELDIGVETNEKYRGMGLAPAAAMKLAEYALSRGLRPVWACHSANAGSRRTAEKLGFIKTGECLTFRKKTD